jgi:hypothetical protein
MVFQKGVQYAVAVLQCRAFANPNTAVWLLAAAVCVLCFAAML